MAVRYHYGRQGVLRNWLYQLRKWVPFGIRVRVWRRNGHRVMRRRRYASETPFFRSIELETRTRCNSSCSFCAASILTDQRPDILMPDVLYHKIIEELAAREYDGAIKFFVNNEPLLDKRTSDFVRLARERVPTALTEVHTNGLRLNVRNGRELLEAGLQLLVINNYSDQGKMHRGVKAFLEEVAPDFPDCEIRWHLRELKEELLNRGGTAPNGTLVDAPLALPCLLPFEEMVVTADGRVTICCQDHYFESAVGNVRDQSLAEIWNSEGFRRLRAQLLRGDRSQNKFCQVCDFKGFKEEHLTGSESILTRVIGDQLY